MLDFAVIALFGCAAVVGLVIGTLLTRGDETLEDRPAARPVHPVWPVVAMIALGLSLALRHATPLQIGMVALAGVPLVGAWYADAKSGLIPDWFTLAPLALVAIYVVHSAHWFSAFSAAVVFVPFALTALVSRGKGMGWGDVKLATLCGSLVGMMAALPALAVACLAATVVSYVRDRGKRPVAFGPYIVVSTFVALALII